MTLVWPTWDPSNEHGLQTTVFNKPTTLLVSRMIRNLISRSARDPFAGGSKNAKKTKRKYKRVETITKLEYDSISPAHRSRGDNSGCWVNIFMVFPRNAVAFRRVRFDFKRIPIAEAAIKSAGTSPADDDEISRDFTIPKRDLFAICFMREHGRRGYKYYL